MQIFPAVVRALKNKAARHALTEDLKQRAAQNRCNLDHQQFLIVVKLFNALLQNESPLDENGIAAQLLSLGDTFFRVSFFGALTSPTSVLLFDLLVNLGILII